MLIRADQQYQLGINSFVERLQKYWLENFRYKFSSFPPARLRQLALAAVEEAEAKGIENEDDIVAYADLCLVNKAGFAAEIKSEEKDDA
jgi:hypothetical protein